MKMEFLAENMDKTVGPRHNAKRAFPKERSLTGVRHSEKLPENGAFSVIMR